jgi:ribokinase
MLLARQSLGSLAALVFGILASVVLTRALGAEARGEYALAVKVAGLVLAVAQWGIPETLLQLLGERRELDALVGSSSDVGERYEPGELDPPPRLVVSTSGALGGWAQPGGPFRAAPLGGPVEDAYGAGDSFAAGLTYALADGRSAADAIAFASERGAAALLRRGAQGTGVVLEG